MQGGEFENMLTEYIFGNHDQFKSNQVILNELH